MNDTVRFSVVEFYHLPGFMQEETAQICDILSATKEYCEFFVKTNTMLGFAQEYRYEIVPTDEAEALVKSTNSIKTAALLEFRHKVYGEPIPVGYQL